MTPVEPLFTIPNLLTGARLVLAPIFLWLYVKGETRLAVAAFALAAATDLLDGIAARVLDQRTRLGAILDPIADKVLSACALFALAARGRLPMWLAVLDASRDVAQFAGAAFLYARGRYVPVAPTRIGKYATFGLAATALLGLAVDFGVPGPLVAPWIAASGLVAAQCVAVSWVQYFRYFQGAIRGEAAPEP